MGWPLFFFLFLDVIGMENGAEVIRMSIVRETHREKRALRERPENVIEVS